VTSIVVDSIKVGKRQMKKYREEEKESTEDVSFEILVWSCLVLSGLVWSCLVLSGRVWSVLVLFCLSLSCLVLCSIPNPNPNPKSKPKTEP
jgi:hypothetical protein